MEIFKIKCWWGKKSQIVFQHLGLGLTLPRWRPQVPGRVLATAHGAHGARGAPALGPPPRPQLGPKGKDKEAVLEAPWSQVSLQLLREPQAPRWFAGGLACSQNCGCALPRLHTLLSLLVTGVAAGALVAGLISGLWVLGLVAAVPCIICFLFNTIILLLVFIVLFSVCACLALNQEQQGQLPKWLEQHRSAQNDVRRNFHCRGF